MLGRKGDMNTIKKEYPAPITNDVLGHLREEDVDVLLAQVEALK